MVDLHGLSLSLAYELRPFAIRVRLIVPGGAETDFSGRSLVRSFPEAPHPYAEMVERTIRSFSSRRQRYSSPQEIAADIYKAAVDPGHRVVHVAGRRGRRLLRAARLLGENSFQNLVRRTFSL